MVFNKKMMVFRVRAEMAFNSFGFVHRGMLGWLLSKLAHPSAHALHLLFGPAMPADLGTLALLLRECHQMPAMLDRRGCVQICFSNLTREFSWTSLRVWFEHLFGVLTLVSLTLLFYWLFAVMWGNASGLKYRDFEYDSLFSEDSR
jgi:hypothetical protein